jgi:hypothetical protein
MSYSCQFCGEIEEGEVIMRCGSCGGEKVLRGSMGNQCADCEETDTLTAVCPTCGSDELEA